jgi:HK97 gp10 family phage protein
MAKKPLSVTVTGGINVIKALREFGEAGDKEIANITQATAKDIEFNAKRLAPVDTGYLKDHIFTDPIDKFTYRVISPAPYSVYQEFGTRFQPGTPFMYPAFRIARKTYPKDLEEGIEYLTNKFNKG